MASPDFEKAHPYAAATGTAPVHSGPVTVPAGGHKRFPFTHRSEWVSVFNSGLVNLSVAFGPDAVAGSGGTSLPAGQTLQLPVTVTEVYVINPGTSDGTVDVTAGLSNKPATGFPAITVANSYPQVVVNGDDVQLGVD